MRAVTVKAKIVLPLDFRGFYPESPDWCYNLDYEISALQHVAESLGRHV